MSMIARFVAITPDQLATIKDTPEMVGGVFALDAGLPFESPSDLGQRLRRQAPQLVADMLERLPPAAREQLWQRLGLGDSGLPNPAADNVVLLQLAQREAPVAGRRRRAEPPATASRSTRRGTAFITCYAASSSRLPALLDRPCSAAVKSARTGATRRHAIWSRRRSPRSQVLSSRRAWSGSCTGASMARR